MSLSLDVQILVASPVTEAMWQSWFQAWWLACSATDFLICPLPTESELTLRLTDAQEMQELNRTWRGLDKPTDVLSFAALEDTIVLPKQAVIYLGDIAIGVPVAQTQALQEGHSLELELAWLGSHGFLHLLGWDHQDPVSLEAMITRQLGLLTNIGLSYEFRL